jgi:hypothetical protein
VYRIIMQPTPVRMSSHARCCESSGVQIKFVSFKWMMEFSHIYQNIDMMVKRMKFISNDVSCL